MKVETFVTVLDEVLQQLQSRFGEQNVEFMKQLSIFTLAGLLSSSNDITSALMTFDQFVNNMVCLQLTCMPSWWISVVLTAFVAESLLIVTPVSKHHHIIYVIMSL